MTQIQMSGAANGTAYVTSTPIRTVYRSAIVHSLSLIELQVIPDALVCVSAEGVIEWMDDVGALSGGDADGWEEALRDRASERGVRGGVRAIWLKEGFMCPGLIDTHTHAPQFPNVGLGSDLQLLEWLDKITFPTEAKFGDEAYARKVYDEVVKRTLRAGTTTSCYYATIHDNSSRVLADVCRTQGQRAFIGKCNMDRSSPPNYIETTSDSLASTRSFIAHLDSIPSEHGTPLVQPIITPRFAISCTPDLLRGLGELAHSRTPSIAIQTHMSENLKEIATVKDMFKDECGGCETYAGVYERYGLLGDGTILAHCVHLDEEERAVLRRTGAGVSHCPSSNLFLNSGAARIRDLLHDGIKVGLGTDCSGGPSISILTAMRNASYVAKFLAFTDATYAPFSTAELFYLATRGGARLCRLDGVVGGIEAGMEMDAVWVRPASPGMWVGVGEGLGHDDGEGKEGKVREMWEKWVWTGDDRDVAGVWVKGRRRVRLAEQGVGEDGVEVVHLDL